MAYVRIVVLNTTRFFEARLGRVPIPGDVIEAGGESFVVQPGVRLYTNPHPANAEAEVTVLPSAPDHFVDVNKMDATKALRAGMVSVADLAGVGERIAAAFPSAEDVFSGKQLQEAGPTASECARRVEVARAELDAALSAYQQAIASPDNKVGVAPFHQAEREAIEAINNRR